MTESTALQPGTTALEPSSTVVNPSAIEHISGGGKTALSEKDDSGSVESVLEAELAGMKAAEKAEKPEAKPEDEGKDKPDAKAKDAKDEDKPAKQRAEDGKFAKAEKAEAEPDAKVEKGAPEKAATGQEGSERRTSEGRHPEPPARFLPEARAKWANVPNEVKAEFHRVSQEMETETKQYRVSHERYSVLKEFDDLARTNGRDLRESLVKVNEVENAIARNPIAGLEAVLREIGPRKADGTSLTMWEVANHIVQGGPQAYQQSTQQAQPQQAPAQQQEHPEIKRLTEQVNALVANQTIVPVIQTFADDRPDFDGLSDRITQILGSGVIEKLYGDGLSLEQRLSEAYRMAGGQGPSSRSGAEPLPDHSAAPAARPVNPDAGKKSVRGAPADGGDTSVEEPDTDIEDMLRKELRRMSA